MSTKNFLTIPKKILFSSPQALGKSPTKVKYYSPQVNKVSRNSKAYAVRKLYFGTNFNNISRVQYNFSEHTSNCNVSELQQNRFALNLDSPTKKAICLKGIYCSNQLTILGRGMFGVIFKAVYKGQFITVKVIKNQVNNRKSIKNEKNLLSISHPNLVRIYEVVFNHEDSFGIILMEDCSSYTNLFTFLIQGGKVDDHVKKRIVLEICYGVEAIHNENILHLDLKPSNILINNQNHVKICDFGSTFNLKEKSYTLFGNTATYTAPELFLGYKPTKKCDIYSLGIIFWEIHNHHLPYEGFLHDYVIYNVCKHNLRPITTNFENEHFIKLYKICWSEVPNVRPSIIELIILIKNL